jgi:hypothetical protein
MRRVTLGGPLVALLACWTSLAVLTAATPPQGAHPVVRLCRDGNVPGTAKVVGRGKDLPVGVTGPSRATLDNGTFHHAAAVQSVDIRKQTYQMGTELNFREPRSSRWRATTWRSCLRQLTEDQLQAALGR